MGVALIYVLACAVAVWSNISARVIPNGDMPRFYAGPTFPSGIVAGHDFWITYNYSKVLIHGGNVNRLPETISDQLKGYFSGPRGVLAYPPFVFTLYAPYTALPYGTAYALQSMFLFAANIAVVGLICSLLARVQGIVGLEGILRQHLLFAVFGAVSFVGFMGYGYLFSLERGNSDAFAMLLLTAFLYRMVIKPGDVWGPAVLLSLAIHIKLTPLVFGAILFWRYRFKCLIPLMVINTCLLFVWGPENALLFFRGIARFSTSPDGWWGDHSIYSFATTVLKPLGFDVGFVKGLMSLIVVAMWGAAWVILWRRGFSVMNALLLYCVSVPVMMVLPNLSNDYTLVMLGGALTVFLGGFLCNYVISGSKRSMGGLILLMGLLFPLSVSGGLLQTPWLINKCPLILALMTVMMVIIVRPWGVFESRVSRSESSG